MTNNRLHNTKPNEVAGATSGGRFEYQYQRAAEACLALLEETDTCCIFLEWHDDFVSERKNHASTLYGFNQVKTRTASQGPWSAARVFGIPQSKSKAVDPDTIAIKLFSHFVTFQSACDEVVLVTNCGVKDDLTTLVRDAQTAKTSNDLPNPSKKIFDRILNCWTLGNIVGVNDMSLLKFISIFKLTPEAARLANSEDDYRSILSNVILKFSEIDLTTMQANTICRDLLDLVTEKSTNVIDLATLPISETDLKTKKGIQLRDLLPLLSLSPDAYYELRKIGGSVVKTLSRLQRICKNSGLNEEQTLNICKLKINWDVWYLQHRSSFQDVDLALLRTECSGLLDAYIQNKTKFEQLVIDAENVARRYEPKLPVRGLSSELVLGLIFALAAERGPGV